MFFIDYEGNFIPPKESSINGYIEKEDAYVSKNQTLFNVIYEIETTDQHKFSRFVHHSLMYDHKMDNILDFPESNGFIVDAQLSKKEQVVCVNKDIDEVVISL